MVDMVMIIDHGHERSCDRQFNFQWPYNSRQQPTRLIYVLLLARCRVFHDFGDDTFAVSPFCHSR
jgi:hypothetical protein